MLLIWTKSGLTLSRFIRWGLREPCSHFAIVFDEDMGGIVFESNLSGTHVKYFPTFKKRCEIVHELSIPMTLEQEEAVYQSILARYDDRGYDWPGFLFFCYSALKHRLFKTPLPALNVWGHPNKFLCTGIAAALRDQARHLPSDIRDALLLVHDFEIISPERLYQRLARE